MYSIKEIEEIKENEKDEKCKLCLELTKQIMQKFNFEKVDLDICQPEENHFYCPKCGRTWDSYDASAECNHCFVDAKISFCRCYCLNIFVRENKSVKIYLGTNNVNFGEAILEEGINEKYELISEEESREIEEWIKTNLLSQKLLAIGAIEEAKQEEEEESS